LFVANGIHSRLNSRDINSVNQALQTTEPKLMNDNPLQRPDRSVGADEVSPGGVAEADQGRGHAIALTFLLTLEDPHRFRKSRDVGCYLGLQPGRRKPGESDPQMHISKEGDPYLRTLLVQGAQHILGPFGIDCDLRRLGLKRAERGERNGKKRAIIATARKLVVLLHHLWVSGEVYAPLHNSKRMAVVVAA
jgi:transposase